VYRQVVLFTLDLLQPLPELTTDVPIEIRLLRPEDVDAYRTFRGTSVHESLALRRLEKGDLCAGAWLDGEIISAGWLAFGRGRVAEIGRQLSLGPDEAYLYDSYTSESFRGHGVAGVRSVWSARYLRAAGYRWTLTCISPENRPAFGPPRKVGYRRLGTAGFVRFGPLRRDFVLPVGGERRWARRREPIVFDRDFGSVIQVDRSGGETTRRRATDRALGSR